MRLLPKDQDWTPYGYLIYLLYYASVPFIVPATAWERAISTGSVAIALPLYFWGYWLRGRRALWVVGAFVVLGSALGHINPAASVFFVYGASYLGKAFEALTAYKYLGGILVLIGVETWLLQWQAFMWIPAVVFTALIGSVVIQQHHSKRLTEKLLRAQEETERMAKMAERERIARDLHDLLGHTLSVIILKSELASRLAEKDPGRAALEIRDVERISREALSQVRSAVRGYRSAGLASELREAQQALETAGVHLEASVSPPELSPLQESVFALSLREAVTNVVRHAQATVCRLSLQQNGAFCEMEIADNGRGGALVEGNGLSGMRQRVEALGGALESDGSRGTRLRIRVPV
ncbi:Integral membrane sensor signal transduction histidine kinase [Candidatus Sulfopaludibacter sp. SbA3]|nr:Integral membrane sensor signal transduction histidine kinase [Candidatus Sulfopaludibacter sp. SbA3]